jgi:hypothetical protein
MSFKLVKACSEGCSDTNCWTHLPHLEGGVNECGDLFPKTSLLHKTYQLAFNIYSLLIAVIYNQLDVGTYQQHISAIYHQQVIIIMDTKNTRCMYNFLFITDYNPWLYQQQLNRVQLYNNTSSICKTQLTFSTPNEMRQQSSTDINLSTGTRPVSSATCM